MIKKLKNTFINVKTSVLNTVDKCKRKVVGNKKTIIGIVLMAVVTVLIILFRDMLVECIEDMPTDFGGLKETIKLLHKGKIILIKVKTIMEELIPKLQTYIKRYRKPPYGTQATETLENFGTEHERNPQSVDPVKENRVSGNGTDINKNS